MSYAIINGVVVFTPRLKDVFDVIEAKKEEK